MTIEKIAIDPVRDRATWLALRQQDITASDIPAVCGEALFGSAKEVWAEKMGLVPPKKRTEAMKRGLWGEAAVFSAIEDEFPDWEVRRAKVYFRDTDARIGATPDGAALIPGTDGVTILQTKVIARPVFEQHWHADPASDHSAIVAPLAYQLQTLTEAMLADAPHAMIVALVTDTFKWSLYTVPVHRNAGAEARIRDMVADFRAKYLDTGLEPPTDMERDEDVLKALYPKDNGCEIDLSFDNELPQIVAAIENARAMKKEAEGWEKRAKTAIADKMKDFTYARLADGRRLSLKLTERAGYTVEPTSFRMLRIVK